MSQRLRFGVLIMQTGPMSELLERFRKVEEWGFDCAWTADHYVDPYEPERTWYDGWSLLAAAATRTSSVRLGPLVSSLTLRNPSLLARQAMTVDHLSNGRLELGLGAAGAPLDHGMTSVEQWSPAERVERLRETIEIVDALLRGGRVDHPGKHYRVKDALVRPRPVQEPRPPLVLAATSPGTIKLAARYADSWSSYAGAGGRGHHLTGREAVDATADRVAIFEKECSALGRDPLTVRRSFLTWAGWREPLPTPEGFAGLVSDYHSIGIDEIGIYWPIDPAEEPKLEAVAQTLPELRAKAAPTDVGVV